MPMLRWLDDDKSRGNLTNVVMKILREDKALSCRGGTRSDNILVHGDNLEALKALLPFYAGKVKCIYIDPPYNTGSAFEHYDDNLEHSTWLNMMYPRLKLLREFLSEDGSIWISIDDREGAYLRVICDEIFGRQNFVNSIHWQRAYSPKGDSKSIATQGEHMLVYRKSDGWALNKLPRTEEMNKKYKNPDGDIAPWTSSDAFGPSAATHQGMVYAIQHPFSGELIYPYANACWRYEQSEMLNIMNGWAEYELRDLDDAAKRAEICGVPVDSIRKDVKAIMVKGALEDAKKSAAAVMKRGQWPKLYFTSNGKGGIRRKTYLDNVGGVPPTNWWEFKDVGHTDEAKKEVLKVFDGQSPFATPKPERLIQRVLTIATNPGDLVMDSFLGSGTTAAVAQKMGRRWIGIEMGEHAKTHCAVRMKKVVDGEQGGISEAVGWNGGGGFRFYELGEAILKEDGTLTADIPFEVMAAHVWFTETKTPWDGFSSPRTVAASATGAVQRIGCYRAGRRGGDSTEVAALGSACRRGGDSTVDKNKSTVLGVKDGVAYALLYNGILMDRRVNGGNVLTRKTLEVIDEDLKELEYERLIIYAEASRLMPSTLEERRIEFKQTPYDLVTRK